MSRFKKLLDFFTMKKIHNKIKKKELNHSDGGFIIIIKIYHFKILVMRLLNIENTEKAQN